MIKFLLHRDGRRYFKMCNPFAVQNKLLQQVTFGAVFLVTLSKLFKNVRDFLKFRYCCIVHTLPVSPTARHPKELPILKVHFARYRMFPNVQFLFVFLF